MGQFIQPKKSNGEYFYFGKKCKQKPFFYVGMKSIIANGILILILGWFGSRLGDFEQLTLTENLFVLAVCIFYAYAMISEYLAYRNY